MPKNGVSGGGEASWSAMAGDVVFYSVLDKSTVVEENMGNVKSIEIIYRESDQRGEMVERRRLLVGYANSRHGYVESSLERLPSCCFGDAFLGADALSSR